MSPDWTSAAVLVAIGAPAALAGESLRVPGPGGRMTTRAPKRPLPGWRQSSVEELRPLPAGPSTSEPREPAHASSAG